MSASTARAGQVYPLPHSAGELVWVGILEAGEVHLGDVLARGRLAFLAGHSSKFEPKRRVAEDGGPRHQREVLEHHGPVRAGTHTGLPSTSTSPDVGWIRPAMILRVVVCHSRWDL